MVWWKVEVGAELHSLEPDADGWLRSGRLPFRFRLRREPGLHPSTWLYTLEHRGA